MSLSTACHLSLELIKEGHPMYVVDLGKEVFEVWGISGKCKEPLDRFADLEGPRLMKSFHFSNLPKDQEFVAFFEEDKNNDEDMASESRLCRLCIRDAQDDEPLLTSDTGVAPWFSGAKWRLPQEGSIWSIKNMENHWNLVEQMNED
jgi:hypothetical protein